MPVTCQPRNASSTAQCPLPQAEIECAAIGPRSLVLLPIKQRYYLFRSGAMCAGFFPRRKSDRIGERVENTHCVLVGVVVFGIGAGGFARGQS